MNKQQHLIALDLDGTLLTDEKVISERTKRTVLKAIEEGHIVVIATGRPHRASIDFYHELGLDTPMVNFNGALIHHPTDHKWDALHSPLPIRTARKIIESCYELEVKNMLAEIMDDVYLDQYDQEVMEIFHTHDNHPVTIGDLQTHLKEDPTSLLIYPHEDQVKELRQELDDNHAELIEHRKWGAPWHVIEIVRAGMNKAVGLDKIARYYHIPKDRIIAFGDEDNDLEMIEFAGVGVAMQNSIDQLKSVAKHITHSNMDDGIGNFLEDYLKLNVKAI
ncbi:Cof-type HAD-IIB family hydrolase [Thalassobacillus pellis]|uniref:Cof-type HAD-IIB family hydrolase n=1 Tax=Thalassobacillus pellis TaxID=748008 RepID=UPI001960C4C7|nr:Cof-type HAD-IIB family hydrolase [Thalassobacillus pellis]MBM7554062.1 Cof subfamily protein (haloacid dehalogenase superfamily) [Thalassobacillus pellis]